MSKEELETLIALGYSQYKIASQLNRSQTNISRWLRKYGLTTIRTNRLVNRPDTYCIQCNTMVNNNRKYCSCKCQQLYQSNIVKSKIRLNQYTSLSNRQVIYNTLCEDFGNNCSLCGLDGNNWNGKPIRLWVDHIDGYANNNRYSNFRLVCPNCDSQLDTCRAKNKGKGRKTLGLKVC